MKIYHSTTLRLKVIRRRNFIGKKIIILKVQKKKFLFWFTVDKLFIDVHCYWGYVPGENLFDCLKMSDSFGNNTEVWHPHNFDLYKRANKFLLSYFERNKEELLTEKIVQKQIQSLNKIKL